MNEDI